MIDWKRFENKQQIDAISDDLKDHLTQEPSAKGLLRDFGNAHNHYVYATHNEIADEMGIDSNKLDEFEQEHGPLAYITESYPISFMAFADIFTLKVEDDFFYTSLPNGERVIAVRDLVL